jgi:hypothetical protein
MFRMGDGTAHAQSSALSMYDYPETALHDEVIQAAVCITHASPTPAAT